jgi:hypothetical protein
MVGVRREGCESRGSSWINKALDDCTTRMIMNSMNTADPGTANHVPAVLITSVDGERHGYCGESEALSGSGERGESEVPRTQRIPLRIYSRTRSANRPRGRRVDDDRRNREAGNTCH